MKVAQKAVKRLAQNQLGGAGLGTLPSASSSRSWFFSTSAPRKAHGLLSILGIWERRCIELSLTYTSAPPCNLS